MLNKSAYIFVISSILVASLAQGTTLRLAGEIWPPFINNETQPRFALEIVGEALGRAGYQTEVYLAEPGKEDPAVRARRLDGEIAVWKTDAREEFMLFSKPYLENRLVLAAKAGKNVNVKDLSKLKGRKVAIVGSYGYMKDLAEFKGPEFVIGEDDQQNIVDLIAGKVDYVLIDELVIHHTMEYYGSRGRQILSIGETPYLKQPLHFAIRKDYPDAQAIVEAFNRESRGMIKDGTYNDILKLNWIQADLDEDGELELILDGIQAGPNQPINPYHVGTVTEVNLGRTKMAVYVEGRRYQNWDAIPDNYRIPPDTEATKHFREKVIIKLLDEN